MAKNEKTINNESENNNSNTIKQNNYNNFDITLKSIFLRLFNSGQISKILKLKVNYKKIKKLPSTLKIPTEFKADIILRDDEFIYLIEIQAQNQPKFTKRNLLYYALVNYEYNLPIIQIMFYVGSQKLNMADSIKNININYQFIILDLSKFNSSMFLSQDDIHCKLLSILTKDGNCDNVLKELLEAIDNIKELPLKYEVIELLKTLCNLRKNSIIKLKQIIEDNKMSIYINPETTDFYELGYKKRQEEMLANDIPKAEAKGIAKGRAEGIAKGKAETLKSLLTIKFGLINKDYDQKINIASIDELNKYLANILSANAIEEVFK